MTQSMSIEMMPIRTGHAGSRFDSFDLAGLLGDGMARASDDGRRRVLACAPFPAEATPQICVAAWHGVLHWLSYNDEPITTGLVGRQANACWPIVTTASAQTSLAQLLIDVSMQWPQPDQEWPDTGEPAHADLREVLRCQTLRLEAGPADHAPELALVRDGGAWRSLCASARYSEAFQQSLMTLWHGFVTALIERPLALLSEQTFGDGLREVPGMSGPSTPIAGSLAQRFSACAAASPAKPAVVDDLGSMSFGELAALSDAWAEALRGAGVRHADHVGLSFGRSGGRAMVAAQLAVLKAGAAFVPMDAAQPAARLQAMADDTDMRLALADAASAAALQAALPGVQCLVAGELPTTPRATCEPEAPAGIDDPAYVIFTSGSTGKPKGVKVSHGNLLNFVTHLQEFIGAEDVVSQFAPFTFDASVAEIHASVLNGATLVILTGELINDPDRLQDYMSEQGVTFAAFPPQYAQHLSPARLPGLKTLLTAGSAPDHALVARWQPHLRYINAYGPTETTILSTVWQPSRVPGLHEPIVIGAPISNTQVRVANRFNQPLPHGVIGELLIGGEGVTHGYIKRDALTRERFITLDDTRWYRSGDLASLDADGRLVFAGRVDSQIKLRGHRLEPGEVEAALLAVDGIRQAAVAVTGDAATRQLVAFCVGTALPEEALRQRLQLLLPAWALPNRIVWIDSLPVTRNGKTDYARLVEGLAEAQASVEQIDAADYADGLEAQVAAIWGGVLQQPRVRPQDTFIHLGGDSLTALVVTSAVRRLGYSPNSAQLLQHPRLADYVKLLHAQGRHDVESDYTSHDGPAPLAPIQGWFFSLGLDHPGSFCQSLVFESEERIDAERLAQSCARLAGYHDQLRARFVFTGGEWQQEIMAAPLALPDVEVVEATDAQLDAASQACCRRLAAQLRLDAAPLFRMALIQSPQRSRVVWVLHHLLVDTVSHGILLDDLHQLYRSAGLPAEQVLPGKSTAFGAWAGRLQQRVEADAQTLLAAWRPIVAAVGRAQPLPLARDRGTSAPVVVCEARLSREETKQLVEDATQCFRQKPEELVLAATYRALARSLRLQRIAIDVEWHGREDAFAGDQGLDRTVGWFTSVHPLCMPVNLEEPLGPWLMALKEARAAIPHRGREFYALRYLSRDPQVRAQFAGYRQPDVLFNFSGVVQRSHAAWRTVPIEAIEMGEGNANPYAMSVETEIRDGELIVSCYSRPELWPAGAVQQLGRALPEDLREVLRHCCDRSHRRWTPSDFPQLALTQSQVDELPRSVRAAYPLTDMQQTMWRHKDTYQVFMCYRMPGRFAIGPWMAAVAEWIGRHDCLRTCVKEWESGEVCQIVRDTITPPLTVHQVLPGRGQALADELIERGRRESVRVDLAPMFHLQSIDDGSEHEFRIVLSIHHLIHDGWSIELLLGDLLQTYRRACGEDCAVPGAPLAGIADVVALQQQLRSSADWRAYWGGLPWDGAASQLPCTARRAEGGEVAARRNTQLHLGAIDPHLAAAVRAKANELGVTINSLWLAGYAALLRYLGGLPQVRCGVIQSGRSDEIPGVETITGCCANTLPLVLDFPSTQTLAGIVADVNRQLERMRAAAAYPLSAIHEEVKSRLGDEMFGTLFNIESRRYGEQADAARPVLEGGYESTNHGFIFGLIEQAPEKGDDAAWPRYQVRIGYDADRHDATSVAGWLDIYTHCMGLLATHADVPWKRLQLLPARMRDQLVGQWNRTDHPYRQDSCIHDLIAEQAARTPEAVALVCEDRRVSYRELDERANRLAQHLRTLGVGPDVVVGCCFERSIEMVVGLLGVLKAGGAYVPLDPELPAQRLGSMAADIGTRLVLTQDALARGVWSRVEAPVQLLRLDADWPRIAAHAATLPQSGVGTGHLAYVIFTSGSTGKPKAAMNEHGALVNRLQWMQDAYRLDDTDRVLQKTPFSFDVSVWEFFWPLMTGATLVVARPGGHRDPAYLSALIQDQRITTLHFVPSMLQVFVDEGNLAACTSVRRVITSGEGLPGALSARFLEQSRAELHNLYGPTEAAIDVSFYPVRHASAGTEPIGRPIWNTRLYVLDESLQPVPVGVCGELYIAGLAVGRGYLGRDDLTAERFLPSPFVAGERMYRTGDLARWRIDGEIEFLGRTDHQVKIRGLRIELGEIEHALCAHGNVRQALVTVKEEQGRKQLVAYVAAKALDAHDPEQTSTLIRELVESLGAALPDYMVPAAFVVLDALPLNANGKVDRARLPEPGPAAHALPQSVAPDGDNERALWTIWKDVLGHDAFGVTDSFFALGGDSILAIQVASRAAKQGLPLQPRQIIEEKTIRSLAARLAPRAVPAVTAERAAPAPAPAARQADGASHGEQRLLPIQLRFLQDDRTDASQYNQYAELALPAQVDEAALKSALRALVARHDVFRLKFHEAGGAWIARYRPELPIDDMVDTVELAAVPSDQQAAAVAEATARAHASLDIKQGRLCKWLCLRGGAETKLVWIMHHLVVDGVSWRVLVKDLHTALAQSGRGETPSLDARTDSYQTWAARLHDHAFSPSLETEKAHWLRQLALPAAPLRLDAAGEAGHADAEQHTEHVEAVLDAQATSRLLHEAHQAHGTRTHQLLIAALARTLAEWLDGDAVRIDLEGHGREALFEGLDLSETVGWFTTLYPVHLAGLRSPLGTLLPGVREQLEAVPNNGIGYGVLCHLAQDEDLEAARERLGFKESDVLFNYLGQFGAGERGGSFVSPRRRRSHALRINALVQDGVLRVTFDHSRHQLQRSTVAALASRFMQVLHEVIAHGTGGQAGDGAPFALAGLSPADIDRLREKLPALQDAYPCTGMQQGLLLFSARQPQGGAYVTQMQMTLEGVDPVRLRGSWETLAKRHAILRTAFADVGQASMLQMVVSEAELCWRELDLRCNDAELERCLTAERERPFQTDSAPPMRLLLARTSDQRYVLAWTYHHALLDGWSMAFLLKDLLEIHGGSATEQARGPSYRQYIEWLQSRDHEAASRYWRDCFEGVPIGASASLPTASRSGTEAPVDPGRQKAHTIELSEQATAQLGRLARSEGVGLGTVMLAAWGLLLSKYNAEPQVLFGYSTSGRPSALPDIEYTAGLFINSLPMCLRIDGDETVASWLARIQRTQLDHEDHGHLPLAEIQRHAGVQPGQSLFDSLVVVENYPLDRSAISAAGLQVIDVKGVERNSFGLTLVAYPGERLRLELAYQAQKFDDAVTGAMLTQLCELLNGFGKGGAQTIAQLSILSEAERERAVHQWNDTAGAYPAEQSITALFEAQAVLHGPAPALVFGGTRWSYAQLAKRAAAVSSWLRRQGVRQGDKVALSLEKSPDLIAAMLGILRAGAAYVPVAVDCPLDRRAFIAADAGIRWVVTRAAHAQQVAVPDVAALLLEDCPDEAHASDPMHGPDSADATAYVIYTSGTTGTPKGVAISHRNLVNFCTWCLQAARCGAGDRITQFAPYTFDASAGEIFGTLIAGAELHLLADTLIQDPRALAQYLCAHDIRFAAFPPAYVQQMDPAQVPSTLSLLTAGSAPTPELVKRWGAHCRYINGYGPTETTILSSAWMCERGAADGRALSIGRPIANTTMYVVDRVGQLCAPGLVGEIWIGGDGVAQGYLNRPELTAQQFLADPFRPGGRVYRTGDLGRWRDDGCIEFVGRRDRQVKLRGFRIELGEIEARMRQHPDVKEAVVLVRGEGADQQLLAWIVTRHEVPGGEWVDALRAFIRKALPDYMLPQAITVIDKLPTTANGKLDEKALPSPEPGELFADRHVAARTPAETRLVQVWAEVLKIRPEQISATANFFELGGHSLLAMRVISRLREESGLEIGVAELFANPVLADLAVVMEGLGQGALPRMERVSRDKPLALSFAQNRLWFLDQMEGVSRTYQIPGALRLQGRLDEAALRRALDRIVARHESLRTTFELVDGEPAQRIGPQHAGFQLDALDLSGRPDAELQLQRAMEEAMAVPFDLSAGPLVRGRLIRVAPEEHVLLILMHHIVMDGWSLSLLLQELAALYGAYATGREDPLPPLALHYADYAAWQQQWLTGALWQEQCDHWRTTLAGAPPLLELPTDRARPAQQDYAGALVDIGFDAETTAQLKALSRHHGTTLFMTLLAAWSVVLSRLSGQLDMVIGTPVANRAQLETEPMIGFFVNPLALRLDLSGNPTLAELLQRVKARVLDAQRYQQLPFEQVVEIAQPPRSLAHTPVFQVMLNWQDQDLGDFALEGLQAAPLRPSGTLSKYDLTLDVGEVGDCIAGVFEYATALFDAETLQRQAGYLKRVVEAMAADMTQPVQALDLLGEEEHRALQAFNDTARPELHERCWIELFDEQAERTPERIAVRCGQSQLTYRELQQRATRLAAALAEEGAGPGEIVALLDQRGIELLVMIVAVLKSGAAYMPLDPAHPPQRWLDVLQEAQPLLLWVGEGLATEQRWLRRKWADGAVVGTVDLSAAPSAAALPRPSMDDLAYVLFTSGSTGKPKGVMVEQRGMVNNMRSKFEPLGLGEDDVIAQTASQCFDISVWQFLTGLLLGAKVLIAGDELTRDPEALLDHLAAERVTVWEPVPSVMQAALACRKPLGSLRWVMPTGEALSRELVARWFEQYPAIPLMNAYGPAECSDDVALHPIQGPVERVLIGKPVPNAQLHVVDEQLMLLPIGAVGELAVSGAVVGRGYIGRPEETQAAFRSNPHARHAGEQRLYLTGDLVRRWPDGSLEFIGRKDFQVKIRGFRIELGEIESALAQHPAVREAIVAARERAPGDHQLVAYVTLDEPACNAALQAHLRAQLPDYMLPAAIVVLDAMPLNANGKVDRKALPEPTSAAYARADYEAPRSDTERAIASLWQELLQVPQVGRGDSYFDLGGNSLLLIRMLSRLKDLRMTLGVTEVYQLRTVSACAAAIDARQGGAAAWPLDESWRHAFVTLNDGSGRSVLLLDRRERVRHEALRALLATLEADQRPHFVRYADDLGAMSQQVAQAGVAALTPVHNEVAVFQGLWTALEIREQSLAVAAVETSLAFSPIQRNLMAWQGRDTVDVVAVQGWHSAQELQGAFAAVAAEQDMLRAAPDTVDARWRLLAADAVAATAIPVVDLSTHDPARHAGLLQRVGAELLAARSSSSLAYVAAIVSLSDLEHRLVLAVDHLVWDGLSAPVLQQRLQHHLLGNRNGLDGNYRDYVDAAWKRPEGRAAAMLETAVDRADLAATMRATRQALARRAQAPLQSLQLRVPLDASGGTPADQAFDCFKRVVQRLTGLDRYGVVLNHHGRQSGEARWFEQVGLFLDKVPMAADADTAFKRLAYRAQLLQKLGVNYLGLAQAPGSAWADTLPPLAYEVLFNFQADAPQQSAAPDQDFLMDKLKDFRGILFEAAAGPDGLALHCAFRGSAAEAEAVSRISAGLEAPATVRPEPEPDDTVPLLRPAPPVYSLEVLDVRKRYGDFEAVKGVSFSVRRGCCFGILGPNGAGKTSLLAMIEGLVPITAGSIRLLGMDVATEIERIQPHVGVQLQQNNYFQFLTVAELLKFYQELRSSVGGKRRGLPVASLLERLDLQDKLDFKVEELSGGQKQRLSIAIALLEDPDVIFLDEPTSALDPHSRIATWEFIEDLKKDPRKTVILTTHYMEEAERLCDEILLMDKGKVIAQGEPSRLVKSLAAQHSIQFQFGHGQFRPALLEGLVHAQQAEWDERSDCLRLRTSQVTEAMRELLALSQAQRIDMVNIEINRPTLEHVFLSHTGKELSL